MKRSIRSSLCVALAAVVASSAAAGCGGSEDESLPRPSEEFCEVAYEYDENVTIIGSDDPAGHLEYLEPMAALSPEDLRGDFDIVVDALKRLVDGDDSVVGDDEVEAANRRINRRAIDGCRLHDQNPPGGF